jgi:hypothetical protein
MGTVVGVEEAEEDGEAVAVPVLVAVAEVVAAGKILFPHPELGNMPKMKVITINRGRRRIQRASGARPNGAASPPRFADGVCIIFT